MRATLVDTKVFTKNDLIKVFDLLDADWRAKLTDDQQVLKTFLCMWPYDKPLPEKLILRGFSDGSIMFDADGFRMPWSPKAFDIAVEQKMADLKERGLWNAKGGAE